MSNHTTLENTANAAVNNTAAPLPPGSIAAFKHSRASLSAMRNYVTTEFNIPQNLINKYFKSYYLLYWEPRYFAEQLERNGNGTITRNGTIYQVCYEKGTTPALITGTRGQQRKPPAQVALSFRRTLPEFGLLPVVLVRSTASSTYPME